MGLNITAEVECDNCNGSQTPAQSMQTPDAPLPANWARVQGYANVSGGASEAINGYFCPVCIASVGLKGLVKKAADVSPDLTGVPA